MRKILAILLALTMVVGLGVSAWAASVTIKTDPSFDDSNEERTYNLYKIFDAKYEGNTSVNEQADVITIYIAVEEGDEYDENTTYYIADYVEATDVTETSFGRGTYYTYNEETGDYEEADAFEEGVTYYEKGYVEIEAADAENQFDPEDGYIGAGLYTAVADAGHNVSYTIDVESPWVDAMGEFDDDGVFTPANGQIWFELSIIPGDEENYLVTLVDGTTVDTDTAIAIAEYLNGFTGDIDPDYEEVGLDDAQEVDEGYYLIVANDDSANLALVTTDVVIIEKNDYMTSDKTTAQTSYKVGDPVEYTITVDIPSGAALTIEVGDGEYEENHGPIIVHDVLDTTLDFDASTFASSLDSGYTLVEDPEDDCTFDIIIPITEELRGTTVTFTYTAYVNKTATPDGKLVNKLWTENNNYKTPEDTPVVYTFDFDVMKTFEGSEDEELQATFQLKDEAGTVIKLSPVLDADGEVVPNEYVVDQENGEETFILTNTAEVNIKGLNEGVYTLTELETENGYNMLTAPVYVIITDTTEFNADGSVKGDPSHVVYTGEPVSKYTAAAEFVPGVYTYYTTDDDETAEEVSVTGPVGFAKALEEYESESLYVKKVIGTEELDDGIIVIENKSGTLLPSTGGIGTTIFYIVGGLLAVGAGVVLVTKKRMSKEDI